MHPILFSLGTFQVRSYSLVMTLVLIFAVVLMWRQARQAGFPAGRMAVCALGMALGGLLGGRLNAWLFHLGGRLALPNLNVFQFSSGATGFGAILGVLGFAVLFAWTQHWNIGRLLDIAARVVPLGEAIQRIGCLLNGCCYGRETGSFLGMYLPDVYGQWAKRYPTQILSGLFSLGLAAWLWSRRRQTSFPGQLVLEYLLVYGTGRVALDFLRGDERLALGLLSAHQLAALLLALAAGLVLVFAQNRKAARQSTPGD
jgi:phosphatidylglycerol:prolipoprotein diacylglycerol transferase